MDPRIHCHILCPPVSETHSGGSTDAQGARREENKGMESTRVPGEDQLYLSRVVESKMLWEDMVSCLQNRKQGTDTPYKHVCIYGQMCMHTHVYI